MTSVLTLMGVGSKPTAAAGGGGGPEVTGTPVEITWEAGDTPAGQSITIPADATAVYVFWTYFANVGSAGLTSASLATDGAADATFELPTNVEGTETATGVAAWYNPTTGSQTLTLAWDTAPSEGSTTTVVYVKGGDTTAWRDADADSAADAGAVTVTLTTVSGDLVLKYDQHFGAGPSNTSGWASVLTGDNNGEAFRLASIIATGATQVCPSEDEYFSSICAISIPPA